MEVLCFIRGTRDLTGTYKPLERGKCGAMILGPGTGCDRCSDVVLQTSLPVTQTLVGISSRRTS